MLIVFYYFEYLNINIPLISFTLTRNIYIYIYIHYENLPYLKNDSDMYYHFIAIMRFVDGKYCFLWLSRVLAISHKQRDIILLTLCRCRHKSDNVTQDLSLSYIEQQIRLRIKQDQIIQFPQYEIHPLFIHEYILENEYMSTLI